MSFVIQKRPKSFSAALQPIVYQGQRSDATWNTITNNGGTIRITFTGANVTANYSNGDEVYVKSNNGAYDAIGICSTPLFGGVDTTLDVTIAYTANATNGLINNHTKRPSYRLSVNFKDATTNALLFSDAIEFSADLKDRVIIDAQLIKNLIRPRIDSIVPFLTMTLDALKYTQFYVSITEVWTGSANGAVDDSANPRTVIFGDMEVNGANDYLTRLPNKILTIASKLRAFIGKPFDLSFFGLTTSHSLVVDHYAPDGTLTTDAGITMASGVGRIPILPLATDKRMVAKIIQALTIPAGTSWQDYSGALSFTKATSTLSAAITPSGTKIYRARTTLLNVDLNSFDPMAFSLAITGVWTGTVFLEVRIVDRNANYRAQVSAIQSANGTTPLTINTSSNLSGLTELYPDSVAVFIQGNITSGSANVAVTIPNGQVLNPILSAQEIEVQDAGDRPVTLSWMNKFGGQDWWTFRYSQEINYATSDTNKTRRVRLRADDLTYDQWQMLNGLNTTGLVYGRAYSELSLQLKGKQRRIDGQAYLLLDNYTLLEVVVIPTSEIMQTKRVAYAIDITIELPAGFEGNNFFKYFSGRTKRFVTQFTNNLPSNEWEVYWFGGVLQTVKTTASYIMTLQLPAEPIDLVIKVRKRSNNGIAQNNGTITFTKNGTVYPGLDYSFNAGDDLSDLTFVVNAVDASTANPFDRVNIIITE